MPDGSTTDSGVFTTIGSGGGGAIQLSAGGKLTLSGAINADGGEGYSEQASAVGNAI